MGHFCVTHVMFVKWSITYYSNGTAAWLEGTIKAMEKNKIIPFSPTPVSLNLTKGHSRKKKQILPNSYSIKTYKIFFSKIE